MQKLEYIEKTLDFQKFTHVSNLDVFTSNHDTTDSNGQVVDRGKCKGFCYQPYDGKPGIVESQWSTVS